MLASDEFRMKPKLKYLLRPFFGLNQSDEIRRLAMSSYKNTVAIRDGILSTGVAIHDGRFFQRVSCFVTSLQFY